MLYLIIIVINCLVSERHCFYAIYIIISWYLQVKKWRPKKKKKIGKLPKARKASEYPSQDLNLTSRKYCFLELSPSPIF